MREYPVGNVTNCSSNYFLSFQLRAEQHAAGVSVFCEWNNLEIDNEPRGSRRLVWRGSYRQRCPQLHAGSPATVFLLGLLHCFHRWVPRSYRPECSGCGIHFKTIYPVTPSHRNPKQCLEYISETLRRSLRIPQGCWGCCRTGCTCLSQCYCPLAWGKLFERTLGHVFCWKCFRKRVIINVLCKE